MVGANTTVAARLSRLRRLLRGQFSVWTQVNITGLEANKDLLTSSARADYEQFRNCRNDHLFARVSEPARFGRLPAVVSRRI